MASRRKARILAFQALFFWEANCVSGQPRVPVEDLLAFGWLEDEKLDSLDENMAAFSRALIAGAVENIKDVDAQIQNHLDNWDIVRLNRVDLAILRISTYTLMYQKEIPASIVIDEAIGICREFGTDDSYKFVNGVLDSIKITLLGKKTANLSNKEC